MLILAIILTILGVIVFRWYSRAMSEPFYNRPLIFSKTIPVLIINLLWIFLDRKSTRLNSSHIPYLVCRLLLEKKKQKEKENISCPRMSQ